MILTILFIFIIGLCLGSFFNSLAYRITYDKPIFSARSYCPKCYKKICWFDNIPLISWILLKGSCRNCKKSISTLYPLIELGAAILITLLFIKIFYSSFYIIPFFNSEFLPTQESLNFEENLKMFLAYFVAFTALICSIRTDLEEMVIPQFFSLWLIPVGTLFAYLQFIKISFIESILGAILGYSILWISGKIFSILTSKEGIGVGDMELLAMIGSFFGPKAVISSLLIGSVLGLIVGGIYLIVNKKSKYTKIPFGPFLAVGTFISFFFESQIDKLFF